MEKAKQLLGHPNFNKLSPKQIQQVFESILASGVSKEQIAYILREIEAKKKRFALQKANVSHLELLPRNVFKHMVEVGEIKGKDLLYLCNSSPILKNYCLADSKDINGQVIEHQEIYALALKKALGKDYKSEVSPLVDFSRLLGTYTVIKQDVSADGLLQSREELFNPHLIREISKTPNVNSVLDYKGNVYIGYPNRMETVSNNKIDVSNIVKITSTEYGTLMMDSSDDLWYVGKINMMEINGKYGDGSAMWNYDYYKPIKLPKTFSVFLNAKEGFYDREFKIKDIMSDAPFLYFLTKDGNLLKSNYPLRLGEEDRKGNFKKIYVEQISEGVKSVQSNVLNQDIAIIKYSGTIVIIDLYKTPRTYRVPTNVMPKKIRVLNNRPLLVLDEENRLWKIEDGSLGKIIETNIIDFDLYISINPRTYTEIIAYYFVKADGVVYRKFDLNGMMDEIFYNEKPIKKIKMALIPKNYMHEVLMFSPVLE